MRKINQEDGMRPHQRWWELGEPEGRRGVVTIEAESWMANGVKKGRGRMAMPPTVRQR
jgi:hypothetical protein